jgi:hypothetical protein
MQSVYVAQFSLRSHINHVPKGLFHIAISAPLLHYLSTALPVMIHRSELLYSLAIVIAFPCDLRYTASPFSIAHLVLGLPLTLSRAL